MIEATRLISSILLSSVVGIYCTVKFILLDFVFFFLKQIVPIRNVEWRSLLNR